MAKTGRQLQISEVGRFRPGRLSSEDELCAGDVGYCIAGIKDPTEIRVGDTILSAAHPDTETVPGYDDPKQMVFCGLYPANNANFPMLREALETLHLNDCSFVFQPENSQALGPGYRCGFLGLLHMEVVQQRLERESDVDVIQTAPTVTYELEKRDGEVIQIQNPNEMPPIVEIKELREPICRVSMIVPAESVGTVIKLAESKRGRHVSMEYLSPTRVILTYKLPMAEMLYDFYDKLKSGTRGYGTMDYEFDGFETGDLVRVDFIVGGEKVDALSSIMHRGVAETRSRAIAKKLKSEIPRHVFEVAIHASSNNRVIVRESIPALTTNAAGNVYSYDITRKKKLWVKQREGQKRLKQIGQVNIPQEAFLAVLRVE